RRDGRELFRLRQKRLWADFGRRRRYVQVHWFDWNRGRGRQRRGRRVGRFRRDRRFERPRGGCWGGRLRPREERPCGGGRGRGAGGGRRYHNGIRWRRNRQRWFGLRIGLGSTDFFPGRHSTADALLGAHGQTADPQG